VANELSPLVDAIEDEFAHRMVEMVLHGPVAEEAAIGDLVIGEVLRPEPKRLFTEREGVEPLGEVAFVPRRRDLHLRVVEDVYRVRQWSALDRYLPLAITEGRDKRSAEGGKEGRMGESDSTPTAPHVPVQGPVVFEAPPGGWSRATYHDAVQAFTRARHRAPQTVIMHPHTLDAVTRQFVRREVERVVDGMLAVVDREEQALEQVRADVEHPEQDGVTIVTCDEHDRTTIVMK
jgi:hypothetical protein